MSRITRWLISFSTDGYEESHRGLVALRCEQFCLPILKRGEEEGKRKDLGDTLYAYLLVCALSLCACVRMCIYVGPA